MRTLVFVIAFLVPFVSVTPARAAALIFSPTPDGLTISIENKGPVAGLDDTFEVWLTLTTDGYVDTGSTADLLAAFAVDFSAGALGTSSMASSPAGFTWTLAAGDGVAGNSARCAGSEPGAVCVEEASSGANLSLATDGTYSWLFYVGIGDAGFSDTTSLEIAVATLKSNGKFQGNYAFTATAGTLAWSPAHSNEEASTGPGAGADPAVAPVPEPGSLVLLGSGLLFAASRMRRRKP